MSGVFSPSVRAVVENRSGGLCEVCGSRRATQMHHRRPRGMGGSKRTSTATAANCLHVDADCHNCAESHRVLAILFGWLVPQQSDPEVTACLYRGCWARLSVDGTIEWERSVA